MNNLMKNSPPQVELALVRHCALVTCGQQVRCGETLATSNSPERGDIHAPFPGKVLHVDSYRIRLSREKGETVPLASLDGLSGPEIRSRLAELGADLAPAGEVDALIINAVDAEPSVCSRKQLLADHAETLRAGIKALVRAYCPGSVVLALRQDSPNTLDELEISYVGGHYPAGLDPMVAKAVTGVEASPYAVVVGLETVHHTGMIVETGLPVSRTMVTLGDTGRLVSLGTPVGALVEEQGETVRDGDRIVLGGVLQGMTAASPGQGVDRSTTAVTVVKNPAPVAEDTACVGCGECVRHCPARLDPAMITSYAEFGDYEKAAAEHVDVCFECGLCGYYCLAHRPMLQYIRLAKSELAKARSLEEVAS